MKRNHGKNSIHLTAIFLSLSLSLCGCQGKANKRELTVTVEEYERITYETTEVMYGDISPVITLRLTADSFVRKNIYPTLDDMEADTVYVKEGDTVKKGDLLMSFKAGDLAEQKQSYLNRQQENALLIEHYEKLAKLQNTDEYKESIESLKEDQQLVALYIQELEAKIDSYNIRAEQDGVVVMVSQLLNLGKLGPENPVVTMIYGSDDYKTQTSDDYDFKIGETYTATYGVASYQLNLTNIETCGTDSEGATLRELTFTLAEGEEKPPFENINMTIEKPVLKNVLYVPAAAVFTVEDKTYVYVMDENGFRHGVEVKIGNSVDGYTVIESGLAEGDRVVIK